MRQIWEDHQFHENIGIFRRLLDHYYGKIPLYEIIKMLDKSDGDLSI